MTKIFDVDQEKKEEERRKKAQETNRKEQGEPMEEDVDSGNRTSPRPPIGK